MKKSDERRLIELLSMALSGFGRMSRRRNRSAHTRAPFRDRQEEQEFLDLLSFLFSKKEFASEIARTHVWELVPERDFRRLLMIAFYQHGLRGKFLFPMQWYLVKHINQHGVGSYKKLLNDILLEDREERGIVLDTLVKRWRFKKNFGTPKPEAEVSIKTWVNKHL